MELLMPISRFLVRTLAVPALLAVLVPPLAAQSPSPIEAAPAVSEDAALAAWRSFKAAPLDKLEEAPTFLRYMQGGAVHTVLNGNLLFWMYKDYPPEAQAVLYAAYMGGNLESQLVTRRNGDDPEAAMSAVLDAYAVLKANKPELAIERLDRLTAARESGHFAEAVADLGQGKP
jgi:hypothetical protein